MTRPMTYTNPEGKTFGPLPPNLDGYEMCIAAAGATLYHFAQFGSYQGRWVARVTLPDGRDGWLTDYYGSCSSCDAFEAALGWSTEDEPEYPKLVIEFGTELFDTFLTQSEMETEAAEHARYSIDDEEMLKYVKEHA